MRPAAVLLVALVALPPLAAAGSSSVTGAAYGYGVVNDWDMWNFWVNSTGPVTLTLTWTLGATKMEDLQLTWYKPGVWDTQCPPHRSSCVFQKRNADIVAMTHGCPPLHASESVTVPASKVPLGRGMVVVEGIVGHPNVPYTLTASSGEFTRNATWSSFATFQVIVPPC